MNVTVTGGTGHSAATLVYDSNGLAEMNAQALAADIDKTYTTATYYKPANPPVTRANGYLIVPTAAADHVINATGFGAIVDENNGVSSTIDGGNKNGQIVLSGDGGLDFNANSGSISLAAGGGDNSINLGFDTSTSTIYTSGGNDTIHAGGAGTISAGLGDNIIGLRHDAGAVEVLTYGQDTVRLGIGDDTIQAINSGQDVVVGAKTYSGSGFSLTFIGSSAASTVLGGAGSYNISGGAGGGIFFGGAAGGNSIVGGSGSVTIFGGGAGDTLEGGAGDDKIVAAAGNETLGGGAGTNIFNLTIHQAAGSTGAGTIVTVTDFNSSDFLKLGSTAAENYALSTATIAGNNTLFKLEDGTTVVLHGFTHLTSSDFKG